MSRNSLNGNLTSVMARVPIETFTTTGVCTMGNFITNYGCSGFIPLPGADQVAITLTQVNVFGQSGDKKSVFAVTSRYKTGFVVNSSSDFHGALATVSFTATVS